MWLKSCYFNDNEIAELILKSDNPGRQKYLGRRIKNFDRKKWEEVWETEKKKKLNLIKCYFTKLHAKPYAFGYVISYKRFSYPGG